jgi:hypothetical protein
MIKIQREFRVDSASYLARGCLSRRLSRPHLPIQRSSICQERKIVVLKHLYRNINDLKDFLPLLDKFTDLLSVTNKLVNLKNLIIVELRGKQPGGFPFLRPLAASATLLDPP